MEYHYVVTWSESKGWYIDWETTLARFDKGKNVFVPNLNEWVFADPFTETGETERDILYEFQDTLDQLNNNNWKEVS